ncbi:MAG: cupin domain-containing protein [Deltaproteobacteria bacterium]
MTSNDNDNRNGNGSMKTVPKPWGYEIWWAITDKYVGKILHIRKGHCLSFQYHHVKDETFYLKSGSMLVEIEEAEQNRKTITVKPGDAVRITPLTRHRLTALEDCEVFEVSTPEVEDVVRLEDRYGRV